MKDILIQDKNGIWDISLQSYLKSKNNGWLSGF